MSTRALLCGDHDAVVAAVSDLDIVEVPGLCFQPELIGGEAASADRLVLGLWPGRYSPGLVQSELRSAGFDPFGVPLVDLREADGDSERLGVYLAAAIARAEAFSGSSPQQSKPVFPREVSRRDLLRFPRPEYVAAPLVEVENCAAAGGCRACAEICPQTAYQWTAGRIEYDKSMCEPCGLCVTTCPTGAITHPVATGSQVAAQIEAIVETERSTPGIVYGCRRASEPLTSKGWYQVELPCAAMATPQWLLAPLLMGAGAVVARPCSEAGCDLRHDEIVFRNVDYCRRLLVAAGTDANRVSTSLAEVVPGPWPPAGLSEPFSPGSAPDVLIAVAAAVGATDLAVNEHPASPTAEVLIDPEACTGCTGCAQGCPTGALAHAQFDGYLEISFDAAACTACGQCVPRCPEIRNNAIELVRHTDLGLLQAGRTVQYQEETLSCELCGLPIAPAPMMKKIESLLGPEQHGVLSVIESLCLECRGAR